MRPHQWAKNGFVLVGPLFAMHWSAGLVGRIALAFAAFCAISSAVYVANDVIDVEADRAHPTKRKRPIASGEVSIATAWRVSAGLALVALALAGNVSFQALGLIVVYAALQYGYSTAWKHVVVIDVFLIAFGFMLRLFMGTVGLGIPASSWLVLCGLMITLFLGFAKRRSELMLIERSSPSDALSTRKVLEDYSPALIEQYMSISAACAILAYSLYTVAPQTIALHHTPLLILSVPFVIYGIFRYLYLLHRAQGGADAAQELFTDRHLLTTTAAWSLSILIILAFRP